jgi:hypothetical protein
MSRLVAFMVASLWAGAVSAQSASSTSSYDLNVYPVLAGTGAYDLNIAPKQSGPPGTVTMTSAAPPAAYSFKDMLANTHGYVSTGVSSRGGYNVEAGVSMPIVPGKADLDFGAGTGQTGTIPGLKVNGKSPNPTYDTYYASLHIHPTDDFDATIGISGIRMKGVDYYGVGPYGMP